MPRHNNAEAIRMGANLAKTLRAFRAASGESMEALGRRSGTSRDTIMRIEHGATLPRLDTFYRLCVALGVGPETLVGSPEDYYA